VEVAALGVLSKAPYQLLAVREALIWRTEELARNACDTLEREDFAAAAMLTRGVAESAALIWYLLDVLRTRTDRNSAALNEVLMRVLAGWKKRAVDAEDDEPLPEAINILTCVQRLDREIPGFQSSYASLSEFAHPNWMGVTGLFSNTDQASFTTHFGRGFRSDLAGGQIGNLLNGAIELFVYAYNTIAEEMPTWLAELDQLWPDRKQ
jgi:hypothetical protein